VRRRRLEALPRSPSELVVTGRLRRGTVPAAATSAAATSAAATSLCSIWNASSAAVAGPAPSVVVMTVAGFSAATGVRQAAKHEGLSAHTVTDRLLSLSRNPSGGQPEMKEIPKDPLCPAEFAKAAPEINSKVISWGICGVWILCRGGATN